MLLKFFEDKKIMMKIAVIGTGYVGLVSGTCFAELGFDVVCVDKVKSKVESLQAGIVPIYEPQLEELIKKNVAAGRLQFSDNLSESISGAEVISIAVGTPTRKQDGNADLTYVYEVAREIANSLKHYAVIVTKSTVPAGTNAEIKRIISSVSSNLEFDVASNPEFLREGSAIDDFLNPERVVVGTETERARTLMAKLYQPLQDRGSEIIHTDLISSELIKYAANTFLATKVSFINEMADLCEKVGGNIVDVARGMGTDSRIGSRFLQPGPGYGGSCFPKDTLAMVHIGERALSPITIVEAVIAVNRSRPHRMVAKIIDAASGEVRGKKIALLGLAFKANTDDVRDSVALIIAEELARQGAEVIAYDPKGMPHTKDILGDIITYADSTQAALSGADLAVIATEWKEFAELTNSQFTSALKQPLVIDLRNLFNPQNMAEAGITYHCVGRQLVNPSEKSVNKVA
jgi:UDPglucose 6-dehydrogenase